VIQQVNNVIGHISESQLEMAKILEAQRYIVLHTARFIHDIPHENPSFETVEALTENTLHVTKNVAAYLNSLAELTDALGDNLLLVLKEVDLPDGEE